MPEEANARLIHDGRIRLLSLDQPGSWQASGPYPPGLEANRMQTRRKKGQKKALSIRAGLFDTRLS